MNEYQLDIQAERDTHQAEIIEMKLLEEQLDAPSPIG